MEENKPLVSVILTCYNRENYIRRSLESIINQTYTNLEIVVVDDCSTDNSVEIIKSYNDKRIKLICLDVNGGIGIAKKTGGDNSSGEYLCFLDSDDYLKDDYVEVNINKALEGDYDLIIGRKFLSRFAKEILEAEFTFSPHSYNVINSMFLSRKLYNKINFSSLRLFEDRGTLPRLFYYSKGKVGFIPISPYVWVLNTNSAVIKGDFSKKAFYTCLSMVENIEYFSKVDPIFLNELMYHKDNILKFHNKLVLKKSDQLKEKYPEDWNKYITYINSLNSNSE